MRFFIPAVGTTFKLVKPWSFLLYVEDRNSSLFDAIGTNVEHLVWEDVEPYYGWGCSNLDSQRHKFEISVIKYDRTFKEFVRAARFVLPAGTLLKVERVHIRSSRDGEFDSVTMSIRETTHPFLLYAEKAKTGNPKKSLGDFWVKLVDFNTIEGDIVYDNIRQHK